MSKPVINLNQERKRREKLAREQTAAVNRARFGRGGTERKLEKLVGERAAERLDGHRLERGPEGPPETKP